MWGIVPVKGTFSDLAGSAAVAADGGVTGRLEVKSASINTKMKNATHTCVATISSPATASRTSSLTSIR